MYKPLPAESISDDSILGARRAILKTVCPGFFKDALPALLNAGVLEKQMVDYKKLVDAGSLPEHTKEYLLRNFPKKRWEYEDKYAKMLGNQAKPFNTLQKDVMESMFAFNHWYKEFNAQPSFIETIPIAIQRCAAIVTKDCFPAIDLLIPLVISGKALGVIAVQVKNREAFDVRKTFPNMAEELVVNEQFSPSLMIIMDLTQQKSGHELWFENSIPGILSRVIDCYKILGSDPHLKTELECIADLNRHIRKYEYGQYAFKSASVIRSRKNGSRKIPSLCLPSAPNSRKRKRTKVTGV